MLASFRLPLGSVSKVEQRMQVRVDLQDDIPALTAIASVGASSRHELFPPEGDQAVSTRTRRNLDHDLVDECTQADFRSFAITASATSEVPTAVGSSRSSFMS